jgi:FMN phosphatase YigB (HAD superfamily)
LAGPPPIISGVRFRAVLFDAGETLVHPEPSFHELFAGVLSAAGFERTTTAVADASRVVMQRFEEAAEDGSLWTVGHESSRAFWTSVYQPMLRELGLSQRDGLTDRLFAAFTDRSNYSLFPDVTPTLEALSRTGLILGVVSNFEAWLEDLLEDLGVRTRLPVRAISGIEGVQKPDARLYELGLERAGAPASQTAFVGDNPYFDVDPPAALGMFPVLIDRRGRHPEFEGPRITSLTELTEILG